MAQKIVARLDRRIPHLADTNGWGVALFGPFIGFLPLVVAHLGHAL